MPNLADALKREIARVARKELKSEMSTLRKVSTTHRSEIAALKRQLKSQQAEVKALASKLQKSSRGATPVATKEAVETRSRPGRKVQYSAEAFAAQRQKLGLTQAQMAALLGVSSLSVYKWESGQVVPRAAQQQKVLEIRHLGKRAAAELLESKAAA